MKLKLSFGVIVALLISAPVIDAQSWTSRTYGQRGIAGYTGVMPGVLTAVITGSYYLDTIVFVNNSSSAVTVRALDITTNCSAGPCVVVPDNLSIAAKTVYAIPYYGMRVDGLQISSSDSSNVVIRVKGGN